MSDPIRVILIDDHSKVHVAIGALVASLDDIALVAHGSSAQEALDLCGEYDPDIVLMDVIMPDMTGIEATQQILSVYPRIKIIALSGFKDQESVQGMINAGAVGYIVKTASLDDIANTIRASNQGKAVFSMEVTDTLFAPAKSEEQPSIDYHLTRREQEILTLIVEGLNNRQIADKLVISVSTVRFHVSSIFEKLGVSNRVEAVGIAFEQHLLE